MPGSPLPRRECESRPLLRVGFALGVPRSAWSRRNGLETSEGYKVGVLTHSGCPGLPGPRPSVSPLLRLGPNTRLAGPGLSAWPPGVHPVAGPPPAPAAGLCWCHGEALAVFSRLGCILTGCGARGQALGPCPPLTGTQTRDEGSWPARCRHSLRGKESPTGSSSPVCPRWVPGPGPRVPRTPCRALVSRWPAQPCWLLCVGHWASDCLEAAPRALGEMHFP